MDHTVLFLLLIFPTIFHFIIFYHLIEIILKCEKEEEARIRFKKSFGNNNLKIFLSYYALTYIVLVGFVCFILSPFVVDIVFRTRKNYLEGNEIDK